MIPPPPITFAEDPVSKTRFAQVGKSVLPSGVNPSVSNSLPEAPAGLEMDTVRYDARGRPQVAFRKKPGATLKLQKTEAPGVWYDPASGKTIRETGNGMFELMGALMGDTPKSTPSTREIGDTGDPLGLFSK